MKNGPQSNRLQAFAKYTALASLESALYLLAHRMQVIEEGINELDRHTVSFIEFSIRQAGMMRGKRSISRRSEAAGTRVVRA